MRTRNVLTDLYAIAAMPGLDELAEIIDAHDTACWRTSNATTLLFFIVGKTVTGSADQLDSLLRIPMIWDLMRSSASSVGRRLSPAAPTVDQLDALRARVPGLGELLAEALPTVTTSLAKEVDLLKGAAPAELSVLDRTNLVAVDGSVFIPYSDVYVDSEGVVRGSKAKHSYPRSSGPRIPERYKGKSDGSGAKGYPISVASVHGGLRWQRVMLGCELYRDGHEMAASRRLLDRVIAAASGGVHAVIYDRLMKGPDMHHMLAEHGVIPIARVKGADKGEGLVLPEERVRYLADKSTGTRKVLKSRVKVAHVGEATHEANGGCYHELWSVDNALVPIAFGEAVTIEHPVAERLALRRHRTDDGYRVEATYRIPCEHGDFEHTIDLTAPRPGKRRSPPQWMTTVISPIPEDDPKFNDYNRLRSDIESVFSTIKSRLLWKRSNKLALDGFVMDIVGSIMHNNAICWDVHVSRHSQILYDRSSDALTEAA